ncbi:sugar phosphate isomerase/epimerase family protein [Micropruina sp.]|uniref:sugar phosphate isomerase/epimerase family protein n=1 Tax=Micropruina sp. TaxID=2737536 RepID=UPI0039E27EA0
MTAALSVEQQAQQYALGHLTIIDTPTPELVRIAARTGYDYVSPRLICDGLPGTDHSLARNPALLHATREALAETGLPVHDIELARIADDVDPDSYEAELAIGAAIGAGHLLSSIWSSDHGYSVDAFGRLCRLAAQYGLTVNLEWLALAAVTTMADAVAVLREVDEPNARLMIDLHHFHRSRERVADLAAMPREWFEFVQICDAPGPIPTDVDEMARIIREGRNYLGEGGTDPAAVLDALPPLVYSVEIPSATDVARLGAEGHARRCLETSRSYLARECRTEREAVR